MNIILTSAGQRIYLAWMFTRALRDLRISGTVYLGDSTFTSASALAYDHYITTPPILREEMGRAHLKEHQEGAWQQCQEDHEGHPQVFFRDHTKEHERKEYRYPGAAPYIDFLLSFCLERKISLVVPLIDLDVRILSMHRDIFEGYGITVLVSDEHITRICDDKYLMYRYLGGKGFRIPKTFPAGKLGLQRICDSREAVTEDLFPLIIKPRYGNGSIAAYEAEDWEELEVLTKKAEREAAGEKKIWKGEETEEGEEKKAEERKDHASVIIQRKVKGTEYGLDIINDLDGRYKTCIVRRKLTMRDGETMAAVTEDNPLLEKTGERLARTLCHTGIMDADIIVEDGIPWILDLNNRFGGGYPFSYLAGCDLPKALILWVLEKEKAGKEERAGRGIRKQVTEDTEDKTEGMKEKDE